MFAILCCLRVGSSAASAYCLVRERPRSLQRNTGPRALELPTPSSGQGRPKNTCLWARESTVFRLAKSVTYKQRAAEVFWASAAGRSGECLMIGCGLSRRIFDQSNQPSLSDSDSLLRAPCCDANCQFGATKIVASPCLPRAGVLVSVTEDMT